MENFKHKLNAISCFVFDMDGVLTDGSLILMPGGEQVRTMNIKDGYALQLAVKNGYRIVVITGGKSDAVKSRLAGLGITEYYSGIEDKISVLKEVIKKHSLKKENVLYMGDDIPDLAASDECGIFCCPSDAVAEIKSASIHISTIAGGKGCVREVIEQVMRLHGKWPS